MGRWTIRRPVVQAKKTRTIGVLSNNMWFFAGKEGHPHVNQFLTQYFVMCNFEHHRFLTRDNQWLVPFGGRFGTMARV